MLDAFQVVKLGSAIVDEVRRRVQPDTLGHRGRKGNPLYGIGRTLQIGAEQLTDKQSARLEAKLTLGDPDHEVTLGLAVLSEAPPHLSRQRRAGLVTRHRSHWFIPGLPDPRELPARQDAQAMEGSDPGLLRHLRRFKRPHRGTPMPTSALGGLSE